ncbi:tripartite tricarboxylate transporter substrate binding protein [Pseudotabrizicola formosa]|uniref:tripartite tricarboxylate transporter substrate binding protein n=1 Tax=Pseudotabrizicola formosa TaxID=2030009 RepID=UPI000CD2CA88|nr:tripartite tricarboxylate transporter substrate-binding protein [Pseudotabrizicola formosa]
MKHTLLSVSFAAALAMPAFAEDYVIIAPAAPGGGWDGTARAMQEVMQAEGISGSVQVQNVPGAGGTVGLAQFASSAAGDASQLIVGGYVMVGAILTNDSPVSLADVTPIARLTGEAVGIAVSASSPIQNITELVEMMKADPGAVSWAGGSAGGVDHITVGLLAKAAGVDPTSINYIAFSGGGEALAAILGNQVTVGISGVGEFLPQVEAGTLRMLAVSTEERWVGTDAPTLMESGYDVNVQNWRMVAAAPGLSDEQKAAVTADIDKLATSAGWKAMLETKGWADTYLSGPEFDAQLAEDIEATTAILTDIGLVQ